MDPGWISAAVALASALVILLAWAGRQIWKIGQRATHFMDDYFGEAARPGVPAKPGLMERLSTLELQATHIAGEVSLNHGRSIKDVVNRTERAVDELTQSVTDLRDVVNRQGGGA